MKINVSIEFQKIREDEECDYLIPEYPFCSCTFNELEKKCKELKERLPENIIEVYVPSKDEVSELPEEIRACGDIWWTSTKSRGSIDYTYCAYCVYSDGDIYFDSVSHSRGFRPIIIRRKDKV